MCLYSWSRLASHYKSRPAPVHGTNTPEHPATAVCAAEAAGHILRALEPFSRYRDRKPMAYPEVGRQQRSEQMTGSMDIACSGSHGRLGDHATTETRNTTRGCCANLFGPQGFAEAATGHREMHCHRRPGGIHQPPWASLSAAVPSRQRRARSSCHGKGVTRIISRTRHSSPHK